MTTCFFLLTNAFHFFPFFHTYRPLNRSTEPLHQGFTEKRTKLAVVALGAFRSHHTPTMPPRKPLTAAQARERERKLIARKERNRASAAAHRERKNATIDELTIQVNKLQEENRRLQALAEENRQLRAALAAQASSVEVEAPPQPPVPQQRAPLQQPSQMLLRIPLVPNHVACQNTNPLPAVYAF